MNNANMQGDGTEHRLERFSVFRRMRWYFFFCAKKKHCDSAIHQVLGFINSVPDSQDVAEPNLRKSLKHCSKMAMYGSTGTKTILQFSFELTSSGELQATSFRVRRLEAWGQADE
ncbi:hypothetical protein [Enterobacter asburiae]|uniref:hypothetical protein n=1 Tax=Enterobacter asburiae TaxID=61645 RepID=UPI0019361776|nr:hypothetical protein [Enterobacter asburiae]QQE41573.1 hypothetical protein I6I13_23560 [Enterobacter asburiae]